MLGAQDPLKVKVMWHDSSISEYEAHEERTSAELRR